MTGDRGPDLTPPYEGWAPHCLCCTSMARMVPTSFGWICQCCYNPIGRDGQNWDQPVTEVIVVPEGGYFDDPHISLESLIGKPIIERMYPIVVVGAPSLDLVAATVGRAAPIVVLDDFDPAFEIKTLDLVPEPSIQQIANRPGEVSLACSEILASEPRRFHSNKAHWRKAMKKG